MSAVLRISGEEFDASVLPATPVPFRQWRKGDPRNRRGLLHQESGVQYSVSEAEFEEFDLQVRDAIQFLSAHGAQIHEICSRGHGSGTLDFAVSTKNVAAQFVHFPTELVQLSARAGIGLEISLYAAE